MLAWGTLAAQKDVKKTGNIMAAPKGNQYAIGNDGGRPLAFDSEEELEERISAFFESDDAYIIDYEDGNEKKKFAPTLSGLALFLGVDRSTLHNYSKKEEYFHTIKNARTRIEAHLEKKLYGNNVTGLIFNLKNNFGWKDKQDIDLTSKGTTYNIPEGVDPATASQMYLDAIRQDDE